MPDHVLPEQLLRCLAQAAIDAAAPARVVPQHLPSPPRGRTVVIGAGKAAAAMAQAVEAHWPASAPLSGVVVTRYGHGVACRRVRVIEAAHPVPDPAGVAAAAEILAAVQGLTPDDLVLCLLSGGGSALLASPAPGLHLADKQQVSRALLRSGASIHEINVVRKHLSAIKGGRLALACAPAPVVSLAISDVPGDDPAVIASGPTAADPSTCADARAVLARYRVEAPPRVINHLRAAVDETPKPGDARLQAASYVVIASARDALAAAAQHARAAGMTPWVLGEALEGDAAELGRAHAEFVRQVVLSHAPVAPPCVLLSGGETTVTVRDGGRGGRNTQFLLALAHALCGSEGVFALAIDTDGIDGTEHNAGAILRPDSLTRAEALGLASETLLRTTDAYAFFSALGDLIVTGPTRTNVNDFRAILVTRSARR